MRIAIYGRPTDENISVVINELFTQLDNLKIKFLVHEDFLNYLRNVTSFSEPCPTFSKVSLPVNVDYLISVGGDGTFLESLTYVANSNIPVLGINTGKLGFLSQVSKDNVIPSLLALKEKKFSIETRSLLCLETPISLFGKYNYALNEICVQRKDSSTMITVHAYLNGEFLNSYWADGLIISTPTGSTAYSLSCSGPVLLPDDSSFIVTPISPHNLNVRPVIIPDNYIVKLKVEGRSPQYLVSLDSRSETFDSSVELNIRKADFGIKLIQMQGQSFTDTLRKKLNWGKDLRNE